ncbi:MAG TPA: helicase HerA-like domain-containing protein, partial [Burkholderiales bacterium]|nr:helicase HerA-like domain-containing protein [Burkholderiales bacterium]
AYEKLRSHVEEKQPAAAPAEPASAPNPISDILFGKTGPRGGRQTQGVLEAATKSAARAMGSELGRQILRGVLGSILGSGRRR